MNRLTFAVRCPECHQVSVYETDGDDPFQVVSCQECGAVFDYDQEEVLS